MAARPRGEVRDKVRESIVLAREVRAVSLDHVRLITSRPIEQVLTALRDLVPTLDDRIIAGLRAGDAGVVEQFKNLGSPLWIFGMRDHGALLRIDGLDADCYQFEIGNPITAESMTRNDLAAGLYAPLRLVLYSKGGKTIAEYDDPSSLFRQFGLPEVTVVGERLERELASVLEQAMRDRPYD